MRIFNVPFAPSGFCTVCVRNDPFIKGREETIKPHPDILIVRDIDQFETSKYTSCSIFMSSGREFNMVMNYDYGMAMTDVNVNVNANTNIDDSSLTSAAKVVVNGGPKDVRFMFDHVGTDSNAPALHACLSVIHEVVRVGGKYEATMNTIMAEYSSWPKFAAKVVETFVESSSNEFPELYKCALKSVFV